MNLTDFRREMIMERTKLLTAIADAMKLEPTELELLKAIIKHTKDDSFIDPTTFESDLKKIPLELWHEDWTKTLGALHTKKLVKVGVRLNPESKNSDPENTTTDQ